MKKERWIIIGVVALAMIVGFFAGDRYARYDLYREELHYQALEKETVKIAAAEGESEAEEAETPAEEGEEAEVSEEENTAPEETVQEKSTTAPKTQKKSVKKEEYSGIVNLNTATLDQLISLDGIGEVKAKKIIEYRDSYGGFKSIEELMNVKGIGEKTFEKNKGRLCV